MRLLYDSDGKLRLLQESNGKSLPYRQVEYLHFDGGQRIETGVYSASDIKVEVECRTSTNRGFNNALFGGRESNTVKSFTVWRHLNTSSAPRFDFNNTQRYASEDLEADVWYKITKDGADNYVDDVPQASNTEATFESETTTITLGAVKTGTSTFTYTGFTGDVRRCRIWKAGVLVRDYVSVLDDNDAPCMYDKVSGQLCYSFNTAFTQSGAIIPAKTTTRFIEDGGL